MGLSLLAPLFLAGLLAVAVPIVVHLVHRERKDPLAFPSLMFLRRVPFRSAKRQRIRYWLLFLLRTAALVLIAAAFARPWLDAPPAVVRNASAGRDVVVMIDRSYSMGARGVWDRARDAALDAIGSAGASDRVAVIAFGERAELLARPEEQRARALAAVRSLEPGDEVTRYGPAFKLAGSVLADATGAAEIVVVTDRQRAGWRSIEQVAVPEGTTVRIADVHTPADRNLAVTDVQVAQSAFAGRQRFAPSARVVNRGSSTVSVPVELRIGGRTQQARTISVPALGAATVRFDPFFGTDAAGEIRIAAGDDVAADDVAYFTTASTPTVRVRVIGASPDATFYFENALRAGGPEGFTIQPASRRLSAADLRATDVVVFIEAPVTGGADLEEFVRQGGGVIAAGPAGAAGLLPVRDVSAVERADEPTTLVSIDAAHPVFAPFRATGAEQFASVRITRYQRSEALPGATVAARFHDGAPAVAEQRSGRGRVIYWGSGLSRRSGDFVLHPAFVPFAQQLVRHAAAGGRVQQSFVVGNVIDVNAFAPADADAIVLTPGRRRVRLTPAQAARTLRVDEAGIYQVRGVGANAVTRSIAANVDVSESDRTPLPAETFDDAITPRTVVAAAAQAAALPPLDRERRQGLWWYLLLAAFALLVGETLLGNRISSAWRP